MEKIFPKMTLQRFVVFAVLIALDIVVGQFLSFGTNIAQISCSFIVGVVMSELAGPVWTGVGFGVSDFVGTLLFGKYGYNWQFTFSAIIVGIIYGFFFYRKQLKWEKVSHWLYVLVAVAVIMLVDTVFFNSLWVSILYKMNFEVALASRIWLLWQIPLRMFVIMMIIPALQRIPQIAKFMLREK